MKISVILIFIVVLINSLVYLGLIISKKKNENKFRLIEHKVLFEGAVFSILMYLDFIVLLYTKSTTNFILGIAIAWMISYLIYYLAFKKYSRW